MKAIQISHPGGPDVLNLTQVDAPRPGADEVLIKVKAAGVNRSDVLTRKNPNSYGGKGTEPIIPGLEVAGEIVEIGKGVTTKKIGDTVCALITQGGYAEYVVVNEMICLPVPKGISVEEAASLPETIFTVWFTVFQQARLQPGEKLLIHGGTSGIGTMGLQMAKALGSPVYTTAGTDEKVQFLRERDLGEVINYTNEAFEKVLKDEKIDVVLDMVGGDYTQKNLDILNQKGRLVYINAMKGNKPEINLMTLMSKNLTLTGSLLKPQPAAVKAKIAKEVYDRIWPLLETKRIEPVIYRTFPLSQASEAHRLMESSAHIGKILLRMG